MEKLYYSTRPMKDYSLNACHSHICDKKQREQCERNKFCNIHLTGNEGEKIIGSKINWRRPNYKLIYTRKMTPFRKKEFKKCKPVLFTITRGKVI